MKVAFGSREKKKKKKKRSEKIVELAVAERSVKQRETHEHSHTLVVQESVRKARTCVNSQ